MMLSHTLIIVVVIALVHSDRVLFDHGYIRFARHGKRVEVGNLEHIDDRVIPRDKQFVVVKTKSLEVLYSGAIRNLDNLRDLFLTNCGIRKVEPKAFLNLPNLSLLHLQDNVIGEVKNGVFNGSSVRFLFLHRNQIKVIETEAFDNMPNLFKIKLNSNKLKSWESGWFKNTPRLTELYFRRNRINYLPPEAFVNIRGGHEIYGKFTLDTKIFLSKNKLGEITPSSFHGLDKISQLYLDRNGIREIPDGAFRDLEEVDVLYLTRNKIEVIKGNPLPKIKKIGILDLSSNLLECLPYEIVILANVTNLEKNNGTCDCIERFTARLKTEGRKSEISYDEDFC